MEKEIVRCGWCTGTDIMRDYHDHEWGVPLHDDLKLFEFLVLEGAQAGLSWITILKKRDRYRQVFDRFDAVKIAGYADDRVTQLLADPGIVRNRLKIQSAISNARCFLDVQEKYGSFDDYIWQFTGGEVLQNSWKDLSDIPATTAESDAMSRDLKGKGFRFVGSTICYAFMQATGMVNDHVVGCYRHAELRKNI